MNDDSFIKNIISSNFLFYRIRNYVTIFFKQEVDRKLKETSSCSLLLHYKESSSFCVWYGMVYCLHSEDLVPVSLLEIILKEVKKKIQRFFFLTIFYVLYSRLLVGEVSWCIDGKKGRWPWLLKSSSNFSMFL